MSECVVRMENPDDCLKCGVRHICNPYVDYWQQDTRKKPKPGQKGCRIICSLPEGHGRLVDADEIIQAIDEDIELDSRGLDDMTLTGRVRERLRMDRGYKKGFKEYMRKRPTLVPAERSET